MDKIQFPSFDPKMLEIPGAASPGKNADQVAPAFGEALERALGSVAGSQARADAATTRLAMGADVDLHDVLIQVEKADISFRAMMEVRNKLLDAYREIMRMQI